jgi:predicted nicotinamide N-methyase
MVEVRRTTRDELGPGNYCQDVLREMDDSILSQLNFFKLFFFLYSSMSEDKADQDLVEKILDCNPQNNEQVMQVLDILSSQVVNVQTKLYVNRFLVRLLKFNCDPEIVDAVSATMARLCGRIAQANVKNKFEFNGREFCIQELEYEEGDLGFKTWHSAVLLCSVIVGMGIDEEIHIHQHNPMYRAIDIKDKMVLELGSGTGLVGMVCSTLGAKYTACTDYLDKLLENMRKNIQSNGLDEKLVGVFKLDWRTVADLGDMDLPADYQSNCQDPSNYIVDDMISQSQWDIIVAADCIYSLEHAALVPKVVKRYLAKGGSFHCLIPHRTEFQKEFQQFEMNMNLQFKLLDIRRFEDSNIKYCYYNFVQE